MLLEQLLNEFSVRTFVGEIGDYHSAVRYFASHKPIRGNKNVVKLTNVQWLAKHEDGAMSIGYHDTAVLTYHEDGAVVINTGGWNTVSTRAVINAYLPRNVGVRRAKGDDYVMIAPEGKWKWSEEAQPHKWTTRRAVITADGTFIQDEKAGW